MTRSLTNELYTPYKDPEREFRSSRRHFKTLSLDELRSPDFNLLSDEEYLEEKKKEMLETWELYMSKTRTDYGSGVLGPKIALKELPDEVSSHYLTEMQRGRSTETFDRLAAIQAQLNNLGREIKKVNEKVYVAQEEEKSNCSGYIKGTTSILIRMKAIYGRYLELNSE
ncbi:hypothetical protein Tco_0477237 [Tanacetum coccineum]